MFDPQAFVGLQDLNAQIVAQCSCVCCGGGAGGGAGSGSGVVVESPALSPSAS